MAALLDSGNSQLETGLVVLLATLPALVSYVYTLGGFDQSPDLGREIEELSLRAVRRKRLGHEGWSDDVAAATQLAQLRKLLSPPTEQSSDTGGSPQGPATAS